MVLIDNYSFVNLLAAASSVNFIYKTRPYFSRAIGSPDEKGKLADRFALSIGFILQINRFQM